MFNVPVQYCYVCDTLVHGSMVYCRLCQHELGHISCMTAWYKDHNYCPYCYRSSEPVIAIHTLVV